jgi:hypothetical protein
MRKAPTNNTSQPTAMPAQSSRSCMGLPLIF